VIQLTMRTNQKYFACVDKAGKLAPNFICTANIVAADGGAAIVAGNRKVLAARLSDAKFFWEQDLKVPLAEQAKKLDQIVFHEKLGTVANKVDRVAKLARWLVEEGIVGHVAPAKAGPSDGKGGASSPQAPASAGATRLADMAEQAARLAKADLVTGMVGEFPELQGVMGGYYAHAEGLPHEVADAIRDHYRPVGQNDDVPTAPVTVAISLADKLDSLEQFFVIGETPTGSKDPFALRRSALGIIRLLTTNGLRFRIPAQLLDFFADRLKVQQREAGVRHDLIDAVFALGGENDLVRLLARVKALQAFVATDDGTNLLAGYKRAANILRKEEWAGTGEAKPLSYKPEPAESALIAALDRAEIAADAAVKDENFEGAMAALAGLRGPIDAFFDSVTVNDTDPEKRTARLDLLARIRRAVHRVADFSKIEG
jgi:glycyl-tRNA synthetase beta chain